MQVYAQQGDTVDDICYRHYGRTQQVVEMVYAANTGLADRGVILPHGWPVELPDLPESSTRDTLQLWD